MKVIRDRTELQGALGELSSLKVLTDSLRSQAHEAANKLHTIVTMVEMGRADEAVTFATNELEPSASPRWLRCCSARVLRPTNGASN